MSTTAIKLGSLAIKTLAKPMAVIISLLLFFSSIKFTDYPN
jgi:hypothetical protein